MNIEHQLQEKKMYISTTSGTSMYPMLRNKKDVIVIVPNTGLKKYDVVLYKRKDKYILHRLLKIKNGQCIIRGDNLFFKEKDKKEEDIIGVLKEFYRGDKLINLNSFGYKFYVRFWNFIYPLRYVFHLGISSLKKIYHLFKK